MLKILTLAIVLGLTTGPSVADVTYSVTRNGEAVATITVSDEDDAQLVRQAIETNPVRIPSSIDLIHPRPPRPEVRTPTASEALNLYFTYIFDRWLENADAWRKAKAAKEAMELQKPIRARKDSK